MQILLIERDLIFISRAVNNAGFVLGVDRVGNIDEDEIESMFNVNVLGLISLTQLLVRGEYHSPTSYTSGTKLCLQTSNPGIPVISSISDQWLDASHMSGAVFTAPLSTPSGPLLGPFFASL